VTPEEKDREWFRHRFPSAHARYKADKAVDALPNTASMATHVDVWIAAYRAAGGKEPKYK
jgi:hypothetical protein